MINRKSVLINIPRDVSHGTLDPIIDLKALNDMLKSNPNVVKKIIGGEQAKQKAKEKNKSQDGRVGSITF